METTREANKFINSPSTSIGGIQIKKENKEIEINPIVDQCWTCGILNPNHNSSNCHNTKKCLKCNSRDHLFFNCPLPKSHTDMSSEQKAARFCIPCGTSGNHTSLDHRFCPEKRKIVNARIKSAREERMQTETATQRETTLIKKTLELSNTDAWPALRINQEQQQKTSTIILLALLDENKQPGIFQQKFSQALQNNGLPDVKYTPEPTAEMVKNTFCATNLRPQTVVIPSNISGFSCDPPSNSPTIKKKVITSSKGLNDEKQKPRNVTTSDSYILPLDILQAHHRLERLIKSAPIELNNQLKSLLPHGARRCSLTFSIVELVNMIREDGFLLHPDRKENIKKELIVIFKSEHCDKIKCSGEFVYSPGEFV